MLEQNKRYYESLLGSKIRRQTDSLHTDEWCVHCAKLKASQQQGGQCNGCFWVNKHKRVDFRENYCL